MTDPFEHHHAEVSGLRLHYAAAGPAGAPLILFVHGFPEFWYAWKDQLAEFSRDHRAVAPDLRGYNLSDKPPSVRDYRAKHLVEDLRQLIGVLGRRKAVVVAHDWGGAVAWSLAAQHPEVVEKLVIINSPHAVPFAKALAGDPAQQAASQYMRMLRDAGAEALLSADGYAGLKALFDRFGGGWKGLPEGDRARYLEAWSRPGALTGALNYYRASPLYPPGPEGGDDRGAAGLAIDPAPFVVRVPTLVIWGEEDAALLPCLLDGLDQVVAELRLERVPDAGHWIVHEQPDTVNRLVRDFLAAPGARAGSGESA